MSSTPFVLHFSISDFRIGLEANVISGSNSSLPLQKRLRPPPDPVACNMGALTPELSIIRLFTSSDIGWIVVGPTIIRQSRRLSAE